MQQQPPPPGAQYGQPYAQPPRKSGSSNWIVILAIIGIGGIFLLGTCAAIAIPAMTKYMRRSKTSEARVNLAKMFDAASTHYAEHGKCPDHVGLDGRAGVTPPLAVNCGEGQGGRCSSASPGGPGGYSESAWAENPVWSALNFRQSGAHYYHYDFRWKQDASGCMFTAQAFGDLDDDGVYSTFERSGAADENGVNAAAGLFIENEIE